MPRVRTAYVCSACGGGAPRWSGQCPHCDAWNTLVEEVVAEGPGRGGSPSAAPAAVPALLAELAPDAAARWSTGWAELDAALGGGLVPGSVVLVGGEPGMGKSTLLLQVAASVAAAGRRVLYVSGEESPAQVRLRAERLGAAALGVPFVAARRLEPVWARLDAEPAELLVLDSVQTVTVDGLDALAGSVAQVRAVADAVAERAKASGMAAVLVGHVTKEGALAGPKALEHLVDVVLYVEGTGAADHRVVRASKNRYGPVDEIAVFRMTGRGLEPVPNPSALFLAGRRPGVAGSVAFPAMSGSRPVLVEVQALATRPARGAPPVGPPQRVVAGYDPRRLALLLAVLDRHAGLALGAGDVFVNVAGGWQVQEPAADAAVVAALASAAREAPVGPETICFGEVGLGGELRAVTAADRRLAEAARMGFRRAVMPAQPADAAGIEIATVGDVRELLAALFR
jgi:DNA repair protein RadA/Sms